VFGKEKKKKPRRGEMIVEKEIKKYLIFLHSAKLNVKRVSFSTSLN
jgi:hypothetical protein